MRGGPARAGVVRQGSGGRPPGGSSHPLCLSLSPLPSLLQDVCFGKGGVEGDRETGGSVEEVAGNTCFEQMGALPQIYYISINGNPFLL